MALYSIPASLQVHADNAEDAIESVLTWVGGLPAEGEVAVIASEDEDYAEVIE